MGSTISVQIPPGGSIGEDGIVYDADGEPVQPKPSNVEILDQGYEEEPVILCCMYSNTLVPRWCGFGRDANAPWGHDGPKMVCITHSCAPNISRIYNDVSSHCCKTGKAVIVEDEAAASAPGPRMKHAETGDTSVVVVNYPHGSAPALCTQ